MNERIKQIAAEAKVSVITTSGMKPIADGCYIISPDKLEKFAELIVAECMEINKEELSFTAFAQLMNKYQEHFGVEE